MFIGGIKLLRSFSCRWTLL